MEIQFLALTISIADPFSLRQTMNIYFALFFSSGSCLVTGFSPIPGKNPSKSMTQLKMVSVIPDASRTGTPDNYKVRTHSAFVSFVSLQFIADVFFCLIRGRPSLYSQETWMEIGKCEPRWKKCFERLKLALLMILKN
jgi:hypothetical protein